MRDEIITVNTIKNQFLGIKEKGHTLNPATLKHYKSTHRYLSLFLKERKKDFSWKMPHRVTWQ